MNNDSPQTLYHMRTQRTTLLLIVLFYLLSAAGQEARAQAPSPSPQGDEIQLRIQQLETELETMRDELKRLKESMPSATAKTTDALPVAAASSEAAGERAAATEPAKTTAQQSKDKPQERPAAGFELGPFRAVPYGTIYVNLFGNSGGTNNSDVPLFATPAGSGGTGASVRQTRLGLRLEGPKLLNAKSGGVLETDFFGGFPAIGIGENFGLVRMRLAYVRLDWKRSTLLAGQDWMLFAPVNPVSIASAAIPQFAAAGNPWSRLPQLKFELRSTEGRVSWQGAVLAPSTGDFPSGANSPALLQPGTGAASRLPFFQSRLAINDKNWLGLKKAGSIGLSGHYGRARVANTAGNNKIDSAGLALDWNMPLFERVTFAGEAFTGRNLAGFQSGVFQGFNPDSAAVLNGVLVPTGPRAIGTRGGWAQVGLVLPVLNDQLNAYASYGLDDPMDEDLLSVSRRDWRRRNQAYAFSLLYKLSPQLTWGLEFRRLETLYLLSNRQATNHLNLGAAFSF